MRKIHKRNCLKKKAIIENNAPVGNNTSNRGMKLTMLPNQANVNNYLHNLELNKNNSSKTWKLINEMSSRKSCINRNITEIKLIPKLHILHLKLQKLLITFSHLLDQIQLASKLPPSNIDSESYLQPTETALTALSVTTVCELKSSGLTKKKAMGLDGVPSKPLRLASSIIGPSLTKIF